MKEHLIISGSNDLIYANPEDIMYIQSEANKSKITFYYGDNRVPTQHVTRTLNLTLNQLLDGIQRCFHSSSSDFIRVGRSLIINRRYLKYINVSEQYLELSDGTSTIFSLYASNAALNALKIALME